MTSFYAALKKMEAALPAKITSLEQIEALPWAGNAAWDVPIMLHIDRVFSFNPTLPADLRRRGCSLAGWLMTGEGKREDVMSEAEFAEYARNADPNLSH